VIPRGVETRWVRMELGLGEGKRLAKKLHRPVGRVAVDDDNLPSLPQPGQHLRQDRLQQRPAVERGDDDADVGQVQGRRESVDGKRRDLVGNRTLLGVLLA